FLLLLLFPSSSLLTLPSFPTRRSSDLENNYPIRFHMFSCLIRLLLKTWSMNNRRLTIWCNNEFTGDQQPERDLLARGVGPHELLDRKSTRLNSSHEWISYAVFCLKKKK